MAIFNRLYVKIYVTIVASLLLVVAVTTVVWRSGPEMEVARNAFDVVKGLAAAALADPGAPQPEQQKALDRLSAMLEADIALYTPDHKLIGTSGSPLPTLDELDRGERWFGNARGPVWPFRLADGRQIVVRLPIAAHSHGIGFLGHLAIVALLLAIGSYPVVRGLTGRLERLQKGVEAFGAGNLATRVDIEGSDEVARVAKSFNRAAERIEELVRAHKMLLANASHELRTPLTRLRMSIELLKEKADPQRKAELEHDIAELDQLIDEILLASRLDGMEKIDAVEEVDLLALAAEEAARFDGVAVAGESVTVRGDARLLRRLLRNLIENAERYGKPPVEVDVRTAHEGRRITVSDAGPGVADADRERIFEPFYRASVAGAARPGTGLGLALVRQIARRHGGDVVPARMDGRSGFVVTLPAP